MDPFSQPVALMAQSASSSAASDLRRGIYQQAFEYIQNSDHRQIVLTYLLISTSKDNVSSYFVSFALAADYRRSMMIYLASGLVQRRNSSSTPIRIFSMTLPAQRSNQGEDWLTLKENNRLSTSRSDASSGLLRGRRKLAGPLKLVSDVTNESSAQV